MKFYKTRAQKQTSIFSRRQFLKGMGCSVGLPFLASIASKSAFGQDTQLAPQKRFVSIATNHGGIFESAMYPDESLLTQSQQLYTGHEISQGPLSFSSSGSTNSLSTILSAPSSDFGDDIRQRMNVLRGLDIPFYIAHHTGGHLGNYARNDGNGDAGSSIQDKFMPTIDQLMAWSSSFYPDLSNITERSMILGSNWGRSFSFNWSSPTNRSGGIEETPRQSLQSVFDRIFVSNDTQQPAPDTFVVDRVIENYRHLRNGNKRLSALDAQRLDDHMDRLFELQRRIGASPVTGSSCRNMSLSGWSNYLEESMNWVEVVEAAFLCGTSAVAVIPVSESNYDEEESDWHQGVAHQWNLAGPQSQLQDVNQKVFEHVFLNLANRLNVVEYGDTTVLDNTLITWSQECGEETHQSRSAPVVTCGSAGSFLNTGLYMDYRNKTPSGTVEAWGQDVGYSGLLYNQWLATALQAMGLPPGEWQNIQYNASAGYGLSNTSTDYAAAQVAGVESNASNVLPGLQA